ncbi:MAG: fatty acid desaturase, partial [Endomicrobiales bacterium]
MQKGEWVQKLNLYEGADIYTSVKQLINTIIPYLIIVLFMFYVKNHGYSYWIILLMAPLASLFMVRVFLIMHDCSHKSYWRRSPLACFIIGHVCGILTYTSFFDFRQGHVIHHATVANLEKRGDGDVWTMTVSEYNASSMWMRMVYRIFRNPFVLFFIIPVLKFIVLQRFPSAKTRIKTLWSIIFTDIMLALIIVAAHFTVGIKQFAVVELPIVFPAFAFGMWIFYVNHNFEGVYWAHDDQWDRFQAAVKGSSFCDFPDILRWFTANIGYHYIHHLNFRIPNYNLDRCYKEIPQLHEVVPLTFSQMMRSVNLAVWDESSEKLISFSDAASLIKKVSGKTT